MITVKQLLQSKGDQYPSVTPDATVLEALKIMDEKDVESLLVVHGNHLVGIVTESDYTRKVALHGKSPKHIFVRDIMVRDVYTASPEMRSSDCIDRMIQHNIQYMPVLDHGCVVGLITLNEAVQSTIFHQRDTIKFLEDMMVMDYETT